MIRISPIRYEGQKMYEYKISQLSKSQDSNATLYIPIKIGIIKGSVPINIVHVGIYFFINYSLEMFHVKHV